MQSPYVHLIGSGFPTVFMSANGIHPDAYRQFLTPLSTQCDINTILYPPLFDINTAIPINLSWHLFNDQLNHHLIGQKDLIGIGHSLGATLLLHNAIQYPNRWRQLFLIDPALFSPLVNRLYRIARLLRIEKKLHPMVRLTNRRNDFFESKDALFKKWRQRPLFAAMSDAALTDFIHASLIESNNGFTLRFPKQWESEIYRNMCTLDPYIWANLSQLTAITTLICGETSNTFFNGAKSTLKPFCQNCFTIPNTTHLLPFEVPNDLSRMILSTTATQS